MSDCCSSSKSQVAHPKKSRCPACGSESAEVSTKTMVHHLKQAWAWNDLDCRHFFCDVPACEVVYFGENGSVALKSDVRTAVGAKDASEDALICYCFGVTRADARQDGRARAYVLAQTEQGKCACETENPSGRCCLKDFPRSDGSD